MTLNPCEIERDRPKRNERAVAPGHMISVYLEVYQRHRNPDLFVPIELPVERDGVVP